MTTPRVFISAAHKSSGKTTISIGLCAAFKSLGKNVSPFKKGPDYIDPIWLSHAAGNPCYNLDFYTSDSDEILDALTRHSQNSDISIIEGNKGLYDGLDLDGSNSNAALAVLSKTPVILVIDSRGMTRGIAPLILGYQAFDADIRIAGVILNKVGGSRHESKLQNVIEHYTDVPVVGAVHKNELLHLPQRHLGLKPGNEYAEVEERIRKIGQVVSSQVDLARIQTIANDTTELPAQTMPPSIGRQNTNIRIAMARDSAFNFYYQNDLDTFKECGAELIEFDTLNDHALPADIDGLFIGGGFPETQMDALAENIELMQEIQRKIENNLPVYAECGGLMYLSRNIQWRDKKADMVGIIPTGVIMHDKPQGRGYVRMEKMAAYPWHQQASDNKIIKAHEFHYSSLENPVDGDGYALRVLRGTGIDGEYDGIVYKNMFACYTHQRNTRSNPWVRHFTDFVKKQKMKAQHT
ncbi:MAG: cobyrinate a,c-diamide synthase [Pseudomonadota bacterium]|nr:cobyrinate a,c-diamide synthase [Pseudomonadota bacterium]